MDILVTGGAGFIGSWLVERLLGDGHRVIVLDDLSTGRLENLAGALGRADRLSLEIGSAADPILVDRLARGCGAIVHLASVVGVRRVLERPRETVAGTFAALDAVLAAAARHGAAVLYTSTSEVYGKSPALPLSEDQDLRPGATGCPRWSYAYAKAAGECLVLAHGRERALPVVVARLFNVVGPRQRASYGMVLPRFVDRALSGRPLEVHGRGEQTRCFAHVREVSEALVRLLAAARAGAASGEVVNVGSDEEIAIRELAERVKRLTGSRSPVTFVPYRQAFGPGFEDTPRRVPDLRKLVRLTGFRPRARIDDVIGELVSFRAAAAPPFATAVAP